MSRLIVLNRPVPNTMASSVGSLNRSTETFDDFSFPKEPSDGRFLMRAASDYGNPIESLTDRQSEVFRLIGDGLSAGEIATRLHISVHTVETHHDDIKRKLNTKNLCRAYAVRRAVGEGMWVNA